MNFSRQVKEEFPASSSSFSGGVLPPTATAPPPQPMEGLHEASPPPFLTKTYEIIEDTATDHIVSWSRGNNSFVVWDLQSFSLTLLPKYFKHCNFSSFVRQLNTYGFRKVDPDKWEFAHESFLRGQRHLLKLIRRRKALQPNVSQQAPDPCVEVGRFGLDGDVNQLQRDKQVLMVEIVKLRQQQQTMKTYLRTMERRLKKTETKQQLMMNFLARAIQTPDFIQHLIHQKHKNRELEDAINRKRRRHIDQGQPPVVNDIDSVAIDDQMNQKDESLEKDDDLDERFWENLLNNEDC